MGRVEENNDTWEKILEAVKDYKVEDTMIFEPMVIKQLNITNALLHDISKSLAVIADAQYKEKTCRGCSYAKECVMYEPNMKACRDYKKEE